MNESSTKYWIKLIQSNSQMISLIKSVKTSSNRSNHWLVSPNRHSCLRSIPFLRLIQKFVYIYIWFIRSDSVMPQRSTTPIADTVAHTSQAYAFSSFLSVYTLFVCINKNRTAQRQCESMSWYSAVKKLRPIAAQTNAFAYSHCYTLCSWGVAHSQHYS